MARYVHCIYTVLCTCNNAHVSLALIFVFLMFTCFFYKYWGLTAVFLFYLHLFLFPPKMLHVNEAVVLSFVVCGGSLCVLYAVLMRKLLLAADGSNFLGNEREREEGGLPPIYTLLLHSYMHSLLCVCVCVCVCGKDREVREKREGRIEEKNDTIYCQEGRAVIYTKLQTLYVPHCHVLVYTKCITCNCHLQSVCLFT